MDSEKLRSARLNARRGGADLHSAGGSSLVSFNHVIDPYFVAVSSSLYTVTRSSADADNRLDAFSGHSRSTNMVPFHMLHIVSYCAIVTLSLRLDVFYDIRLQKIS